jgi:hypothetical protein
VGDRRSCERARTCHRQGVLSFSTVQLREDLQYAYGFFDRTMGDQRVVGHSGGFLGICDFMDIYLDLGYTVIVLSNSDAGCMPVLEFLREQPLG